MAAKTVLIVEDDADAAAFATAVLEEEGLTTLHARNGEAGLEAARTEHPDLIVLDIQMPKKDGFTVFSELRDDEATKHIPVVMLTGTAQTTGVRFSKAAVGDLLGMEPDAYVEKPVDADVLCSTVKRLLGV